MGKIHSLNNPIVAIPLLLSVLSLSACGGGGSSDSSDNSTDTAATKVGVFIDAPVQGLGYQTPSHQGITNENGEFNYKEGEMISFFFDGLDLGETPTQETVPITMLTYSANLARIAQTLDTNPDPDKIDISGISLGDGVREELRKALEGNQDKSIEEILSDEVLANLQTNNNVTFTNQSLVSHQTAATHIRNSIPAIPLTNTDLSRKVFIEEFGDDFEITVFSQDGSGSILGVDITNEDTGNNQIYGVDFTWLLDPEQNLQIDYPNNTQSIVSKLSKNGTEIDFITQIGHEDFLFEWKESLPLALSDVNGLHLRDDTSNEEFCSGRTLSFQTDTATIRERCDGQLQSYEFKAEAHPHFDDAILLTTTIESDDYAIALFLADGKVTEGTFIIVNFENLLFTDLVKSHMVQTSTALQ